MAIPLPSSDTTQDDRDITLVCAIATAIVAVAAGKEGKDAYVKLKELIRDLSK